MTVIQTIRQIWGDYSSGRIDYQEFERQLRELKDRQLKLFEEV